MSFSRVDVRPRTAGSASTIDSSVRSPESSNAAGPPPATANVAPSPVGASASARPASSYTTASAIEPSPARSARSQPSTARFSWPRSPAQLQAASTLLELGHRVREPVAFALELRPAVAERRRGRVEAFDIGRERLAFGLAGRPALPDLPERLLQPRTLPIVRGERAAERLHLGAARGGLLGEAPALVLGIAPGVRRRRELGLRRLELAGAALELLRGLGEPGLEPAQILLERGHPNAPVGLRGDRLPGFGLEPDRAPELELGRGLRGLRLDGRRLRFLERPDGPRALVGRRRDAPVQRVQPLARGGSSREPLVPSLLASVTLVPQVAQPRGRQTDRDAIGLRGQGLVPLGHLGLLAERLQLAT